MTPIETGWHTLGLAIGHATDEAGATGCTVIRGIDRSFRCAAHLLGRASGTRELAVCHPDHVTEHVDAVFLTGGSAYGLDAAAGVMRWMETHGRGHPIGTGVVPIVPAATIFDLVPLGQFSARPTAEMAYAACDSATSANIAEGAVGAGTGATVGKIAGPAFAMKGGVGCGHASNETLSASAIVVTNALGDVRDAFGAIIAGARNADGTFADGEKLLRTSPPTAGTRGNTTIALVAVNALLTKVQLAQVAAATSAAFYRRITPSGTSFDGDVIFAACPPTGNAAPLPAIEALAVAAMEQAIERSVRAARGRDGIPGLGDVHAAG
ncbi:MAG: P1 family peptidase [Phycisphaerae bacterium]|nr:P1 family peptidase [Gemmatimonadaceae bacterium]